MASFVEWDPSSCLIKAVSSLFPQMFENNNFLKAQCTRIIAMLSNLWYTEEQTKISASHYSQNYFWYWTLRHKTPINEFSGKSITIAIAWTQKAFWGALVQFPESLDEEEEKALLKVMFSAQIPKPAKVVALWNAGDHLIYHAPHTVRGDGMVSWKPRGLNFLRRSGKQHWVLGTLV